MNQQNLFVPIQMKLFFCLNMILIIFHPITCKNVMHNMLDRRTRMNSHSFYIRHYPDNFTNVSLHFNENGHTSRHFSFVPINQVESE